MRKNTVKYVCRHINRKEDKNTTNTKKKKREKNPNN
jgi:hypothetical protein